MATLETGRDGRQDQGMFRSGLACRTRSATVFLVLTVACLVQGADPPLRWRWSNPRPHGNNIVDMTYSAGRSLGVQVTERGQLYTSADLSAWTPRETGTLLALRGVCFFKERFVVVGEAGTVLYEDAAGAIVAGTLETGPTGDWLESVAASTNVAVAVGDNGAVYTSADGATWRRLASGVPTTRWFKGVCYGAGRFVAVGELGTVMTSSSGSTWTLRSSGTTADLQRVSHGNSEFTAVGTGGVVRRSPDGVSWSTRTSGAVNDLYAVTTVGPDLLIAGDSEVRLFESAMGAWSNELARSNGPPAWTYYAAIGRPGFTLLGGRTGMLIEGYQVSTEPYLWLPLDLSSRPWLFEVAWMTNLFVAVGDQGAVLTSGDGVEWGAETPPGSLADAVFLGLGGTTNLLVAAGNQGALMVSPQAFTNLIVTNIDGTLRTQQVSTLGVVWHAVEPRPVTVDLQGVTTFQGQYLVTGDSGTVLTSPDGTQWTTRATPVTNLLSGAAGTASLVVVCGEGGTLLTSPDATQWTRVATGTTQWLYRVRAGPSGFLAVGQGGTLLASPDGQAWAPLASGTTEWLTDAAWLDNAWFVAGTAGTILRSPDGLSWTNLGTITRKALYGAATDGRQLLVAGVEGVILRSPVVSDTTPVEFLSYSRAVSTNGLSMQEIFLLGGHVDQRCTLDRRTDLSTAPWIPGPLLEFLDSSGTLYYLQTSAATNATPQGFYRATLVP